MNDFERMIRQFLAHIDVERGLSATVSAYGADLKNIGSGLPIMVLMTLRP